MRDRLPSYVVECFVVSGFDDVESITEMNTNEGPKNSIKIIESYIEKRKTAIKKCLGPNHLPNLPFEFPPGHRIRIQKFVQELKIRHKQKTIEPFLPLNTTPPGMKRSSKKRKIEGDETMIMDSIPFTTNQIRKKIVNWSKINLTSELKENEHYTINVSRNAMDSSKLCVTIRCHCGTAVTLQQKTNGCQPWQISNWTKHYLKCKHYKKSHGKQETLHMFYLPATSASQQTNIPSGQSIVSTYSQGSFSPQSNRGILEAPCSSFPPLTSQPYFVSPYATNMPFIPPSFTNMPFIPLSSHPTYKTYQNDHSSSLEDTSEYGCDSSPSDNNVTSSPGTGTCQTDHSHDNHTLISQSPPLATCTSSGITSSETTNDQVFREAPLSQEKEGLK